MKDQFDQTLMDNTASILLTRMMNEKKHSKVWISNNIFIDPDGESIPGILNRDVEVFYTC